MGQLKLNFRPLVGGLKCDVEIHFLHTYFWAPQQWENAWGAKKVQSRLFLNVYCHHATLHPISLQWSDQAD